MRRVTLGRTGIETSALGYGASSLGSRVDAQTGAHALAAALDAGVTWIDLAPVYGGGRAEEIVGGVLRGRREAAQICTKVGLKIAGGVGGGLRAAVMPIARHMLGRLGPLQGALRRAAPKANARLPLTAELVRGSIEDSLRRLGTDRVELYALHSASSEDLRREEILRALEDVLASGKTRAVGIASDADGAAAALAAGAPFDVVQMPSPGPDTPDAGPDAPVAVLARARAQGIGAITHSILGDRLATLMRRAAADSTFRTRAAEAARIDDPEAALARLLMGRAFARNPEGVVLVSMLSPRSLARNLAVTEVPATDALADLGV